MGKLSRKLRERERYQQEVVREFGEEGVGEDIEKDINMGWG